MTQHWLFTLVGAGSWGGGESRVVGGHPLVERKDSERGRPWGRIKGGKIYELSEGDR